jgi:hypothetical protein
MNAYVIGIIAVLAALIAYMLFNTFYRRSAKLQIVNENTIDLSAKSNVTTSDISMNVLQTVNGSTFAAFIKLTAMNRTTNMNSPYTPLMSIPGVWSLDFTTSTGRSSSVPAARLSIQTVKSDGTGQVETLDLPSFPMQKWVHLAILREGRRFDVMYNNEIVGSISCRYYPTIQTSPLVAGNPLLVGVMVYPQAASRRYTYEEVREARKALSDTRGAPQFDGFQLPKFGCPGGLFCMTSGQPSSPVKQWSSPYA